MEQQDGFDAEAHALKMLQEHPDIIVRGHVVLSSGEHSDVYYRLKATELNERHPRLLQDLVRMLWLPLGFGTTPIAVVGPATGGAMIAEMVAAQMREWYARTQASLRTGMTGDIVAVTAEKRGKDFVIPASQQRLIRGRRAVVYEDVTSTGAAIGKTVLQVHRAEPAYIQAAVLVNRGGVVARQVRLRDGFFRSLIRVQPRTWSDSACLVDGPCSRGEPIREDVGHGREWRDRNPEHPLGRWNAP